MKRLLFESKAPATLVCVSELRHSLTSVLTYCVQSEQTQQQILVCLSEALTNLVQHNTPRFLEVRFSQDSHRWWLEIFDNGTLWDPSPTSSTHELETMTEHESDRGLALLHTLSEQITYQSTTGKFNRLTLSWQRPNKRVKPSLLLVEDDASLCRLYRAYLTDNYEIQMAQDGCEALEIIKTQHIDLIISDIKMPNMGGLSLRERLIKENLAVTTPFIFLTAHDHPLLKQRTADMGVDDYLIKPVNKTDLNQTVNRILQRSLQVFQQLTNRIEQQITSVLAPNLPEKSHGWNIAVGSRNTGIGGGDLLLHHSSEHVLTLMIADIMGHNDSAKFFAYAYAGYLRGLMNAYHSSLSPSLLLQQLSDSALKDNLLSKVTLTSCVAGLGKNGSLTLASAGHPPPMHIKSTGIETINVGGMLPGLIENTRYQQLDMKIKPGERIVFYTDGLFESAIDEQGRNQLEQHVCSLLSDTLNMDINSACSEIMKQFDLLTSNQALDDVTLVIIERSI